MIKTSIVIDTTYMISELLGSTKHLECLLIISYIAVYTMKKQRVIGQIILFTCLTFYVWYQQDLVEYTYQPSNKFNKKCWVITHFLASKKKVSFERFKSFLPSVTLIPPIKRYILTRKEGILLGHDTFDDFFVLGHGTSGKKIVGSRHFFRLSQNVLRPITQVIYDRALKCKERNGYIFHE